MDAFSSCASPRTTDGTIALSNLEAHIDGLELSCGRGELDSPAWSELIDLITLRAQIRGRIADYERASALAEQRALDAPADGLGLLARARTRAALHRFDEALADLDSAERFGSPGPEVEAERAAILQALGDITKRWRFDGRRLSAAPISKAWLDLPPSMLNLGRLRLLRLGSTKAAGVSEASRRFRLHSLSFNAATCG